MKPLLKAISYLGLAITIVAPLLGWAESISLDSTNTLLVVGMFLWFGTAIFWIKHDPSAKA